MQQEADDAEALRRRLYRPDASAADLAVYLRATVIDEPGTGTGTPASERRERQARWPFVAGAAVALVAALLGGTLLTASLAPHATQSPTVSAVASAVGARDRFTEGVQALAVSDRGPRDGAAGRAQAALRGRYLYTIADGDQVTSVAMRFGLCTADVLTALPYGADQAKLPRGQVLLLEHVSDTAREYDGTGSC